MKEKAPQAGMRMGGLMANEQSRINRSNRRIDSFTKMWIVLIIICAIAFPLILAGPHHP
jgi:hypothetical protein